METKPFITKRALYAERICSKSKHWLAKQRYLIDAWEECTEPEWLLSGLNIANLLYQTRLNQTIKLALLEIPLGIEQRPASAYLRRAAQATMLRYLRSLQRQDPLSINYAYVSALLEAAVRDSWRIQILMDESTDTLTRQYYHLESLASGAMRVLSPMGTLKNLHRMVELLVPYGITEDAHAALDAAACTVIRQYVTVEHYLEPKKAKGKSHETD